MAKPSIAQALREVLTGNNRKRAADFLGWDASEVSRFLSGQRGILLDDLDKAVEVTEYALVTRPYLDAMATMCKVGAACECARAGMGECGRK